MTREVFRKNGEKAFSASFYPVTQSITMGDYAEENSFTVWNDRAQAGSVHQEGGLKLLIDRRVVTTDNGGISESMFLDFDKDLVLDFEVQPYEHSKRASILRQAT